MLPRLRPQKLPRPQTIYSLKWRHCSPGLVFKNFGVIPCSCLYCGRHRKNLSWYFAVNILQISKCYWMLTDTTIFVPKICWYWTIIVGIIWKCSRCPFLRHSVYCHDCINVTDELSKLTVTKTRLFIYLFIYLCAHAAKYKSLKRLKQNRIELGSQRYRVQMIRSRL